MDRDTDPGQIEYLKPGQLVTFAPADPDNGTEREIAEALNRALGG